MALSGITGHLILIMAPSGSGKGALIQHLRDTFTEGVHFAVSCTSRAIRPGEEEGKVYHFISRETFEEMIEQGDFLEWAEFGGNLYGTPKDEVLEPLMRGEIVVREVELQGIRSIKKLVPEAHCTVVFIDAGPWELLEKRILDRAPMSEEELALRKQRYIEESASKSYADVIIENEDGNIALAKSALEALVRDRLLTHNLSQ